MPRQFYSTLSEAQPTQHRLELGEHLLDRIYCRTRKAAGERGFAQQHG